MDAANNNPNNKPKFSPLDIKRARIHILKEIPPNVDEGGSVSQELIDYVKNLDSQGESPVKALDISKDESKDNTEEVIDVGDAFGVRGGTNNEEGDPVNTGLSASGEIGKIVGAGTGKGGKPRGGRIGKGKLAKSKFAKKWREGRDKWRAGKSDRVTARKSVSKALHKGRKGLDSSGALEFYGVSKHLSDGESEIEGVEDISYALNVGTNVTGALSKGLEHGSKLLSKAGNAAKAGNWATTSGKLGNVSQNLGLGSSVIGSVQGAVDLYENVGGKGQSDADVVSQVASTASSGLSAGVTIAGAAGSAGTFGTTASAIASGSAALGPVGWAIAGLTILSMSLADLF